MSRGALPAVLLCCSIASGAEPQRGPLPALVQLYNQVSHCQISRGPAEMPWKLSCRQEEAEEEGEGPFAVEVDEKNGFLSWANEGTGGGCFEEQAAMFVAADQRKILLTVESCTTGDMPSQAPRGWQRRDGKTTELPPGAIPRVALSSFLKPGCTEESLARLKGYETLLDLKFALPRLGTTVRATLNRKDFKQRLGWSVPPGKDGVPPPRVQEELGALVDRCLHGALELPFDRKSGTFLLGKKLE